MRKQKGAALIIVMSLLAVSLMIGLMSMQSSQVDERLAGNYKAAAEAQMAAEFGAAYGIQKLRDQGGYFDNYDSGKSCEKFFKEGLSEQERRAVAVDGDVDWYKVDDDDIDAEIIGCQYDSDPLYLSWGQVRDGGGSITSERFVVFGDGGGSDIKNFPPLSNPLVCLRSAEDGCGWDDGDVASYFDGRTHPVPVDFNCNGAGCRTDPDPESDSGEAVVYDAASRGDWVEYVNFLKSYPNRKSFSGGNNVFSQGDREGEAEVIVISGDVKQAGNINTYGVIVVEGGSSLELAGTGHHEGLIIVEEGGTLDLGRNYNVYGAVVALGEITLGGWSGGNIQGGVRYHPDPLGEPGDFVWEIL